MSVEVGVECELKNRSGNFPETKIRVNGFYNDSRCTQSKAE